MFSGTGLSNAGVGFQPGAQVNQDPTSRNGEGRAGRGVQEAIRVLSLRMPRIVGAQAMAPSALLHSAGSDNNPAIDHVIERAWQRVFPTGNSSAAPAAPVFPTGGDESQPPTYRSPFAVKQETAVDRFETHRPPMTPRIIPGDRDMPDFPTHPPNDPPPLYETPLPGPFESPTPLPSEQLQWASYTPFA